MYKNIFLVSWLAACQMMDWWSVVHLLTSHYILFDNPPYYFIAVSTISKQNMCLCCRSRFMIQNQTFLLVK